MKKRRLLLILISALLVVTSSFGAIVACAYSIKYERNDENIYYDRDTLILGTGIRWDMNVAINKTEIADGPFYFLPGAAISNLNKNVLSFTLFCKDSAFAEFASQDDSIAAFEYQLNLFRKTEDGKYAESSTYTFVYNRSDDTLTIANLQDVLYKQSEDFRPILTFESEDYEVKDFKFSRVTAENAAAYGWTQGDYYIRLYWEVPSIYQEYCVYFTCARYKYEIIKKWKGLRRVEIKQCSEAPDKAYRILSDTRSYYSVISNMNDAGMLEDEMHNSPLLGYAEQILGGVEKTVTVEYLENINDKLPFAKKVRKDIVITTYEDEDFLSSVDVAKALNVAGVNVLLSKCKGFNKDFSDGVFKAEYYPGVYLEARTVDGRNMDYYLNPNLSFSEFYGKLVEDSIIKQDLYNYYFNNILTAYPELSGYTPETLYGYFGYAVIPTTFTLNQGFAELFNTELKFEGVVKMLSFKDDLSLGAYNRLLSDYDYPWLARVWNGAWGALTQCEALHIMLYADCTDSDAFASMNGSTDIDNTSGLIKNEAPGLFIDFGEHLIDSTNQLLDSIFGKESSNKLLVILLVVCVGAFLVYFLVNREKKK